jgi:hypothetical protein
MTSTSANPAASTLRDALPVALGFAAVKLAIQFGLTLWTQHLGRGFGDGPSNYHSPRHTVAARWWLLRLSPPESCPRQSPVPARVLSPQSPVPGPVEQQLGPRFLFELIGVKVAWTRNTWHGKCRQISSADIDIIGIVVRPSAQDFLNDQYHRPIDSVPRIWPNC